MLLLSTETLPRWRNGRRARFRCECLTACRFESYPGHKNFRAAFWLLFFVPRIGLCRASPCPASLIFTFHPKPLPLRKEGLALTVAARKKWPQATSYHLKWGVMERNISKLIPGMGRESTERYSSLKRLLTAPLIDRSAHLNVNPFSREMFDMK